MTVQKTFNKLLGSAKKLCNPLQMFILSSMLLFLFELYQTNLHMNLKTVGTQLLVVVVSGGLIFKLCKDGDVNMALFTLGLFLTFWFLHKTNALNKLLESNGNSNSNNRKSENMVNSNRMNSNSKPVIPVNPSNRIEYANGPLNSKGYNGNATMVNKPVENFEMPSLPSMANMTNMFSSEQNAVSTTPVPLPANVSDAPTNANAVANFNGNVVKKGLNGNIPTKGNLMQNKRKDSTLDAEQDVEAYNAVGAYSSVNNNLENLAKYYEKRAEWVLNRPLDQATNGSSADSNAPCIIQQQDARSVVETPSNKLRNYGINTSSHEPSYRLSFEDDNKVQSGFDPSVIPYEPLSTC